MSHKRTYYYDKEKGECVEGSPPSQNTVYGQAPYVIQDSIQPFYHHGARLMCDSKSKLRDMDVACGTTTLDKPPPPNDEPIKARLKERHDDLHKSLHKSIAQLDAGTAPLTEETRALCDKQNEILSAATGMDMFNLVGKKNNPKGRTYKK